MTAYTCPTPGCEVKGYECDEPVHCSICLADLVPAATDEQRQAIAAQATSLGVLARPVDTEREARYELLRLGVGLDAPQHR
jgi:hypothetical protein